MNLGSFLGNFIIIPLYQVLENVNYCVGKLLKIQSLTLLWLGNSMVVRWWGGGVIYLQSRKIALMDLEKNPWEKS